MAILTFRKLNRLCVLYLNTHKNTSADCFYHCIHFNPCCLRPSRNKLWGNVVIAFWSQAFSQNPVKGNTTRLLYLWGPVLFSSFMGLKQNLESPTFPCYISWQSRLLRGMLGLSCWSNCLLWLGCGLWSTRKDLVNLFVHGTHSFEMLFKVTKMLQILTKVSFKVNFRLYSYVVF